MPVIKLTEEPETKATEVEEKENNEDSQSETHDESFEETEESVARSKGWVPKEEYKGNKEEWIDAKEFVARGPLYDAIHQANRKIKKLTETVESFKEHYSKVENTAKQKAIEQLRAELKAASEDRDIERALEVKDKITELTQEVKTEAKESDNVVAPEFETWVEKNQWYETDKVLRHAANGIGFELQKEHPDWSPKKIYTEVESQIKEAFPQKFNQEPERKMTTSVTTSTKRTTPTKKGSKTPSAKQLPDDAKVNYRRLVKSDRNPSGLLTHEQFMKDYLATGGTLIEEE